MSNNYNNCSKERPTPVTYDKQRRKRYRRMLWIHQRHIAHFITSDRKFHFRSEGSFIYKTFELSPKKRNPDTLHWTFIVSNLQDPLAQSIARKGSFKIVPHILPILNRDETTYAVGCLWPHPPASVDVRYYSQVRDSNKRDGLIRWSLMIPVQTLMEKRRWCGCGFKSAHTCWS